MTFARARQFYSTKCLGGILRWCRDCRLSTGTSRAAIPTEGCCGDRRLVRPCSPGRTRLSARLKWQSFDATAEKILQAGGMVAMEKFAVPGKCWQGYFVDPEGNTFGIFQVDENAG